MYNIYKFQCELYKYSSKKTEVYIYIYYGILFFKKDILKYRKHNNLTISHKRFFFFFSYRFLFYLFSNSHVQRNTSRLKSISYIVNFEFPEVLGLKPLVIKWVSGTPGDYVVKSLLVVVLQLRDSWTPSMKRGHKVLSM